MRLSMYLLALVACQKPTPKPATPPGGETGLETTPLDTADTGETSNTGDTGGTDTGTVAPFDCSAIPTGPRPTTSLLGLYASEDFAFDLEGHLISATGTDLVKQDYPPGDITPFTPTGTDPSSMRMLPTGELVYANIDSQTLFRVQLSDGAQVAVASGFNYATGIDVHRDGQVFIGDVDRIKRVDPYEGTVDVIFEEEGTEVTGIINGLTFSEDFAALYFGTRDTLWRVPVDASGVSSGPPALVWEGPAVGELLGLGVDVCGNLYALFSGKLLRFAGGSGEPELLMEGGPNTTNLQWGSGQGGWGSQYIYVTDRSGSPPFWEVDVGVPSKTYW